MAELLGSYSTFKVVLIWDIVSKLILQKADKTKNRQMYSYSGGEGRPKQLTTPKQMF